MLEMDLADLYGVETKLIKRAVRRNFSRFPLDFMFELTSDELANWRNQFGTSNTRMRHLLDKKQQNDSGKPEKDRIQAG